VSKTDFLTVFTSSDTSKKVDDDDQEDEKLRQIMATSAIQLTPGGSVSSSDGSSPTCVASSAASSATPPVQIDRDAPHSPVVEESWPRRGAASLSHSPSDSEDDLVLDPKYRTMIEHGQCQERDRRSSAETEARVMHNATATAAVSALNHDGSQGFGRSVVRFSNEGNQQSGQKSLHSIDSLHPAAAAVAVASASTFTPSTPVRIALFHGFKDNAAKRMQQSKTLRARLPGVEFVACDSPHELSADELTRVCTADELVAAKTVPLRKWWSLTRVDQDFLRNPVYDSLDASLRYAITWLHTHGPFDGLCGFSQGAVLTACLLAKEGDTRSFARLPLSPPSNAPMEGDMELPKSIRFGILVGGFAVTDTAFLARVGDQVHPDKRLPTLHIAGRKDTFVEPSHSEALRQMFCAGDDTHPTYAVPLLLHEGGHYVPSCGKSRAEIKRFIATAMTTMQS
jgi:hypothetical protein